MLKWRAEYVHKRAAGLSVEDSLAHIRELGAYVPMAIRIVKDVEKITTKDATELVFQSPAFRSDKEWWVKFWHDTDKLLDENDI